MERSSCFIVYYSVGYEKDNCIPHYGIPFFYWRFTSRCIDCGKLINEPTIDREDTPKNIATIYQIELLSDQSKNLEISIKYIWTESIEKGMNEEMC